jgi:FkbM family methyltransferase
MLIAYPDFVANLCRYLTGSGSYPYACRVRTPLGMIAPTLYSSHDIVTMSEVFCRRDYQADRDLSVAIDIGSNIGISALYFLTRNQRSRVYCFEPDPRNVDRLRLNLAGYEDRFSIEPVAVGVQDGELLFGTEPTGRYGRISDTYGEPILVSCREINPVIEAVVESEGGVNILKIDAEGLEEQLVSAIRPRLLERIDTVYYETVGAVPLHLDRFEHRYDCQVNRLSRRFGLRRCATAPFSLEHR